MQGARQIKARPQLSRKTEWIIHLYAIPGRAGSKDECQHARPYAKACSHKGGEGAGQRKCTHNDAQPADERLNAY